MKDGDKTQKLTAELIAALDDFKATIEDAPPASPYKLTGLSAGPEEAVAGVLNLLHAQGFKFTFFDAMFEANVGRGGPLGLCSWARKDQQTGKVTDVKVLQISRQPFLVDAIRVAAHEVGHAVTVPGEEFKQLVETLTQKEMMASEKYARWEVIAETVSFLVTKHFTFAALNDYDREKVKQESQSYVKFWKGHALNLGLNYYMILGAATTIITNAEAWMAEKAKEAA